MFYCYILESVRHGRFYVGHSADLDRRLREHNDGRVTATRGRGPWHLVYFETFSSRSEASRREREIKSWKSRGAIEALISG